MTTALLEVDHLTVTYRLGRRLSGRAATLDAVRDVSFSIPAGTTMGLVGESGSGKTTTGRAILRLEEANTGRIVFDGLDVTTLGRRTPLTYRRDVQVVFQDPVSSLNPRLTVEATLADVLRRHRRLDRATVRQEVVSVLDQVGLTAAHARRYPRELSGGQRQRVAIARALVVNPRLIVCDEAVSALDVSTQGKVINLLVELQRELGVSYLFIAHDLAVVRHISSTVGVMYLGRLVEVGPTEDIYQQPAHPYTQMLLDSTLVANPRVETSRRRQRSGLRSAGEPPSPLAPPPGCPFHPRCPHAVQRCREEPPELRPVSGLDRQVACHRAEDVIRTGTLDASRPPIPVDHGQKDPLNGTKGRNRP